MQGLEVSEALDVIFLSLRDPSLEVFASAALVRCITFSWASNITSAYLTVLFFLRP